MSDQLDIEETRKEGGQPGNKNAEKWTEELALKLGEELIEWMMPKMVKNYSKDGKSYTERDEHVVNIYVDDFLLLNKGLYKDIIKYLKEKYESFSYLYARAKNIQEVKLLKYATLNKINQRMTIFVLQNHHEGYSNKFSHDIPRDLPFSINITKREPVNERT